MRRMIPAHPPANTFVNQKFAATFPNSVRRRIAAAIMPMTPIKLIKHFGHNSRKASLFGSDIVHMAMHSVEDAQMIG